MTELSPQYLTMFGVADTPPKAALKDRVAQVLRHHPEARNDDRELVFWYWADFQGLADILPEDELQAFHAWFVRRAEQPETLARRRREIQNDEGKLQASTSIKQYRKKRARTGPPHR